MATGAAAQADDTMISQGNTGILNGTQVFAPIQAPFNLCGVAAAVAGSAFAGCEGGSAASNHGHHDVRMLSAHNIGVLNGTQVYAPVQAPVNACGVAAGVIGSAAAGCHGGASATYRGHYQGKHHPKHHYQESAPAVLASLPQTLPQTLPALTRDATLHGLPLVGPLLAGLLGADDSYTFHYTESARVESDGGVQPGQGGKPGCGTKCPAPPPAPTKPHQPVKPHHDHDVTMISGHNTGILNGTQVYAPIQVPIDASGIAVGGLGQGFAHSDGGSSARM